MLPFGSSLQLFSSALPQNGKDDEGILGFMISDIQQELKRGKQLVNLLKFCWIILHHRCGAVFGWLIDQCLLSFYDRNAPIARRKMLRSVVQLNDAAVHFILPVVWHKEEHWISSWKNSHRTVKIISIKLQFLAVHRRVQMAQIRQFYVRFVYKTFRLKMRTISWLLVVATKQFCILIASR